MVQQFRFCQLLHHYPLNKRRIGKSSDTNTPFYKLSPILKRHRNNNLYFNCFAISAPNDLPALAYPS
jgi:hypothetical protein